MTMNDDLKSYRIGRTEHVRRLVATCSFPGLVYTVAPDGYASLLSVARENGTPTRRWYIDEYLPDGDIITTVWWATKTLLMSEAHGLFKVQEVTPFRPKLSLKELVERRGATKEHAEAIRKSMAGPPPWPATGASRPGDTTWSALRPAGWSGHRGTKLPTFDDGDRKPRQQPPEDAFS